jgi:hypothetical protein
MAVSILSEPQALTPAYNPAYFELDSTDKTELGFRYVVNVVNEVTSETIGTYRVKPLPTTLRGEVDISDLLQTQLDVDFQQLTSYQASKHLVSYRLDIDEEYFVSIAFTDYNFAGAISWTNFSNPAINPNGFSRTMLSGTVSPPYSAGDVILVTQTPSANYRPELEGVHTVLDVFLDTGVYYTVLDLGWIGDGAASAGVTKYADGRKSVVTGISSLRKRAFKGAFKFLDFRNYASVNYILNGGTRKLLTTLTPDIRISKNMPTYLQGFRGTADVFYIVFNIGGTLYRYTTSAGNNTMLIFDALPSTSIITEVFTGGVWVAFAGTIDLTNVESYTIRLKSAADGNLSEEVTITLYNECDYHTTYDIAFLDRFGSFVTIPFYKGSYMSQDVERQNIRTKYGNYSGGEWTYSAADKGEHSYYVQENITYTVNTDQLSEAEAQYMRELLSSPQAYVSIDGGLFQAISIKTASMPLNLKRTTRDRKVSLQFTMAVQDEING